MALHAQWPQPPEPQGPDDEREEAAYDEIIAASFPASDPPPGIIKLGPSRTRTGARKDG
ncbi:MAG TPA: hypothetical protein VFP94_02955 [Terriglobales bacterium]|nr:hypothetical protein [Terriglobales bacterium]